MYVDAIDGNPKPFTSPLIRRLLKKAEDAKRPAFIRKRTALKDGRRRFKGDRYFPLEPRHERQALRLHADHVSRRREGPDPFEVEGVRGRIGGCGSLGRLCYVVLVAGDGPKEAREIILEYKESLPSALDEARSRGLDAASRRERAKAVARATRRFQGTSDAYLGYAVDGAQSFQVRQSGPREFRLDADALTGRQFRETAASYGAHLAASHRRANGAGIFGLLRDAVGRRREAFIRRTMSFALAYAEQVEEDWHVFLKRKSDVMRAVVGPPP